MSVTLVCWNELLSSPYYLIYASAHLVSIGLDYVLLPIRRQAIV